MVSPEKPTHFCNRCAVAMCWTTTYALCGADAFTHEPAGGDALADGEPPQALTPPSVRASVALAHMRCLRTRLPPGGQPFSERAAESRPPGASVPLRADGFAVWALRSPGSRITAPVRLPEVVYLSGLVSDGGSSLTVARQLRFRTGFPWCPARDVSSRDDEASVEARASDRKHSRNAIPAPHRHAR